MIAYVVATQIDPLPGKHKKLRHKLAQLDFTDALNREELSVAASLEFCDCGYLAVFYTLENADAFHKIVADSPALDNMQWQYEHVTQFI